MGNDLLILDSPVFGWEFNLLPLVLRVDIRFSLVSEALHIDRFDLFDHINEFCALLPGDEVKVLAELPHGRSAFFLVSLFLSEHC